MFEDDFIDKEDNLKALEGMLKFLTRPIQEVHLSDNMGKDDQQVTEYHRVPDTSNLSENL